MGDPVYISAQSVARDSIDLARRVQEYNPTVMAVFLRGGKPVANFMRPTLGVCQYVEIVAKKGYQDESERDAIKGLTPVTLVSGYDDLCRVLQPEDRLLLVDELWDTGSTVRTLVDKLQDDLGERMPVVKSAVVYFKEENDRSGLAPDFSIYTIPDVWLSFPWEDDYDLSLAVDPRDVFLEQ